LQIDGDSGGRIMKLPVRLLQRLLIVAIGVFGVWFVVVVVFKIADNRLPWILALAATYGVAAYVVFPRIVRMGMRIMRHEHVPEGTTRPGSTWRPERSTIT
jgi:hypothetical protein